MLKAGKLLRNLESSKENPPASYSYRLRSIGSAGYEDRFRMGPQQGQYAPVRSSCHLRVSFHADLRLTTPITTNTTYKRETVGDIKPKRARVQPDGAYPGTFALEPTPLSCSEQLFGFRH